VRLGEQEPAGAGRARPRERDGGVQRGRALDLAEASWPGDGVDGAALPGQPADDGGCAEGARQLRQRKRAGDVTTTADADAQDAPGASEQLGSGAGGQA
jgi:hypothetical protein